MGIDTVALEGKGFKRLVEEGAQVSAGQPILEMDLDYLNANARSMISPVVCSNIDDFSGLIIKAQGHVVAGQTPLYEIKSNLLYARCRRLSVASNNDKRWRSSLPLFFHQSSP